MSKQDNLTDFLTDVADAIREKKGTTEKINPQNFSEEIRGIESGGGIVPCDFKDVNFYDYEGTILYSYSWDEFVTKNEMPPLPTHREKEGLTCQEWNYTLEEVLEQGGRCDVGAIYIPTDGNTKIIVEVIGPVFQKYIITGNQTVKSGTVIEWGDGTTDSFDVTGNIEFSHIYSKSGKYTITLNVIEGAFNTLRIGVNSNNVGITHIKSVHFGNNISLDSYALKTTTADKISISNSLKSFTTQWGNPYCTHLNIPRGTSLGGAFQGMNALKTFSVPNECEHNQYFCTNVETMHIPSKAKLHFSSLLFTKLKRISVGSGNTYHSSYGNNLITGENLVAGTNTSYIPSYIKAINDGAFWYRCNLSVITLPDGITRIGASAFYYCTGLKELVLPKSLTTLGTACFQGLTVDNVIKVPASVANLPTYVFSSCSKVPYYDFREHNVVPTLANVNAFSSIKGYIVVPDALYDEWIVATNWSVYADRIVRASEFVEPTNE